MFSDEDTRPLKRQSIPCDTVWVSMYAVGVTLSGSGGSLKVSGFLRLGGPFVGQFSIVETGHNAGGVPVIGRIIYGASRGHRLESERTVPVFSQHHGPASRNLKRSDEK